MYPLQILTSVNTIAMMIFCSIFTCILRVGYIISCILKLISRPVRVLVVASIRLSFLFCIYDSFTGFCQLSFRLNYLFILFPTYIAIIVIKEVSSPSVSFADPGLNGGMPVNDLPSSSSSIAPTIITSVYATISIGFHFIFYLLSLIKYIKEDYYRKSYNSNHQ